MRSTSWRIAVMAGCVVLIGAGSVLAQDWPQWRGLNRDGKVAGFNAPQAWPQALKQGWKTTVGAGDATPALVGDKLYVFTRQGGDEVALCLDASDGKELWQDKYAAEPVTGPAAKQHPGPRSSPAVAEGKVVTLGAAGMVSCLDAATGKVVWRKDPFPKAVPQFFTSASPMVVDGMAVVQVGGKGNGAIVAFDLTTGEEKWRWADEAPEYASPVLLTVDGVKQIVALTEKSVVGVDAAKGRLLWQLPFPSQQRAYNSATPIVDQQTVIFMGARRGARAVKVEKQGDGFAAKELWSNPDVAPQYNTPVLKDDLLFGVSDRGNLFCLSAQNGQTAWIDQTARAERGFAAVIDAGSCLVALPISSDLIVFRPSGKQCEVLAQIKVADTSTYSHPVLAGNRIFVKDESALTMWTME